MPSGSKKKTSRRTRSADLAPRPWRVGRSIGKNLYDADDNDIGRMDTPELAALTVALVNR